MYHPFDLLAVHLGAVSVGHMGNNIVNFLHISRFLDGGFTVILLESLYPKVIVLFYLVYSVLVASHFQQDPSGSNN